MNDPEAPRYPTAQTIAAPGVVDTDVSRLELPTSGLVTVVHAEPFQRSMRGAQTDAASTHFPA